MLDPLRSDARAEELARLRRELATAYAELDATAGELERANEELRLVNEEIEAATGSVRERAAVAARSDAVAAALLERVDESVVVVDADLHVRALSSASAALWGIVPGEAEGAPLFELDIGLSVPELRDPLRRALAVGEGDIVELTARDGGGRPVRCTVEVRPLGAGGGAILLTTAERLPD